MMSNEQTAWDALVKLAAMTKQERCLPEILWRDDEGDWQVHHLYANVGDLISHAKAMTHRARGHRQRAEAERLTKLANLAKDLVWGDLSFRLRDIPAVTQAIVDPTRHS
jgi:hypothetical protein